MRLKTLFNAVLVLTIVLGALFILEYILDLFIGDGDGTFTLIRYLQVLTLGVFLLFISSSTASSTWSNILLSFSAVLLFITILEMGFHVYVNSIMPAPAYTYQMVSNSRSGHFSEAYKGLGYIPTPFGHTRHKMAHKGKELYNAEYVIDALGRRIGCQNNSSLKNKKYACFMGCSFTFGVFLNAQQTLACRFSALDTNYISYNYGMNGYGTQHLLASLSFRDIPKEIPQKEGVLIYTYIDHHIRRVIADQLVMRTNDWAHELPFYEMNGDSLVLTGTIGEKRSIINWIYAVLNKSYVLNYFKIVFPVVQREEHLILTGKLIDRSFAAYKAQFDNDGFYLLIYPGQSTVISDYIDQRINILDYSKLFDITDPRYTIPENWHPTALAYQLVAEQLVLDLADKQKSTIEKR